jgi:hypothetical protein
MQVGGRVLTSMALMRLGLDAHGAALVDTEDLSVNAGDQHRSIAEQQKPLPVTSCYRTLYHDFHSVVRKNLPSI